MTPPGERHSTFGLAPGSPRILCRPGSNGPGTRTLPGTTRAEAYAGDKRLDAKCRTAGAGLLQAAGCSTQRAGVHDNRAGQGRHKGPIPLDKYYVQVLMLYLRKSQSDAMMRRHLPCGGRSQLCARCAAAITTQLHCTCEKG